MRLKLTNGRLFPCAAALALIGTILGCSNIEKAAPQPTSVRPDRTLTMDVPEILSGTVSSEAVILGYNDVTSRNYKPVIVSGYGLVVGLNGTGSRDIPPALKEYMKAEASRNGIGSARFGDRVSRLTPDELIGSPDTAVVIVEAVIPQGAAKGAQFDVHVFAEPSTGTTSLEGGTLYTTLLRPGRPTMGSVQAFELAQAYGPIFINPFAEPGAVGKDTINRISGRIMNGGTVVKDLPLKLRLANPSHARAKILQDAINTRFPLEPGQRDATAHGESDELIEIRVPPSFRNRSEEFVDLLQHTTIRQANPEGSATTVKRALLANPLVSKAASLRWQALGNRVLPIIRDLYGDPEETPRMAALRAGAKLDDALVTPHLIQMTKTGSDQVRLEAIKLLSDLSFNPLVDNALTELLSDDDVEVRLEAYEGLAKRSNPSLSRTNVDGKFVLDVVESTKPMIYITQAGTPRIVVFGTDLAVERPLTLSAWSGRFMIKAEPDESQIEVYYRPLDAGRGGITRLDAGLEKVIQFLGHKSTIDRPSPGIDLTYGEVVGALHEIWSQKFVKADFRAEQDRVLAAIQRQRAEEPVNERPEFSEDSAAGDAASSDEASDLGRLSKSAVPATGSEVAPQQKSKPKQPDVAPLPD